MKKIVLSALPFLFLVQFLSAQSIYEVRQAVDLFNTNKIVTGDAKRKLTEDDIQGSPYLKDEFEKGTVYTKSNTKYVDVPLRYNIYNDNIEFDTGKGVQALAAPESVEKVEFGEYTMIYAPFTITKKMNHGFFILKEEGKASLLLKPRVEFVAATKAAAYKDPEPAKFDKRADTYYIKVGTAEAKIVSNQKDMVEVFPDKQKELEAFIKKNKLKNRELDDLKNLVQYYNSL